MDADRALVVRLRRAVLAAAVALVFTCAGAFGVADAHADTLPAPEGCSQYFSPQPSGCNAFNTTPSCTMTAQTALCQWPSNPLADTSSWEYWGPANYWQNCAYWATVKRPDVELYAVRRYGYTQAPGGAWNWEPDAVRAGYAVDHTPEAGDIMVWPDNAATELVNGGVQTASPGGHVEYVEQVLPDGSIISSSMGVGTAPAGYDFWNAASASSVAYFIHVVTSTPGPVTNLSATADPDPTLGPGAYDIAWNAPAGGPTGPVIGTYYTIDQPPSSDVAPVTDTSPLLLNLSPGLHTIYVWLQNPAGGDPATAQSVTVDVPRPMHPWFSNVHRRGHRVSMTVAIAPGSGTVAAVARKGSHVVQLHAASATAGRTVFSRKLSSGRWRLVITFTAAPGYAASKPGRFIVIVPRGAR